MRRAAAIACAALSPFVLFACNALVGVTDVTLGDPTLPADDSNDAENTPTDSAPSINEGGPVSEGDATIVDAAALPPTSIIAVGGTHVCALTPSATVKCWGANNAGQTGGGLPFDASDTAVVATPRQVVGLQDVAVVSSGYDHSCAISGGTIWCWGNNSAGQLGNGNKTKTSTPTKVLSIDDAVSVRSGYSFACALRKSGRVSCWGNNTSGQLGNGSFVSSSLPVAVSGLVDIVAISTGSQHACALHSSGLVSCWGDNGYGQIARSETTSQSNVPLDVLGPQNVIAVRTMSMTTCELLSTGRVVCFGYNGYGDLGTGTSDFVVNAAPTQVLGLEDAVQIESGNHHACALRQTGSVVCWGDNYWGQAGVSNLDGGKEEILAKTSIELSGSILFVGAGGNSSCAETSDKKLHCWGNNINSQLGNGTTQNSFVPVDVKQFP